VEELNPVYVYVHFHGKNQLLIKKAVANGGFVQRPGDSAWLGISLYHQLHCLGSSYLPSLTFCTPMLIVKSMASRLLSYYKTLYRNKVLSNQTTEEPLVNAIDHVFTLTHLEHCFDYIAQAMLCAADTNLEPPESDTHGTDGYGFERGCRNYKAVRSWAEKWEAVELERQ
jgi:hypothetical protein